MTDSTQCWRNFPVSGHRKERLVLLDPRRLAEVAQLDPEVALDCPAAPLAVV